MNKKQICLSFLCGIASCLSSLHAGDYTWMVEPQSGIWSINQPNWDAGEVWPESDGHIAIFGVSTQKQITVSETLDIGGLSFQVDGYHVDGEKLVLSGATPSISVVPAAVSALLETPLQNDSQITKSGAGELRLGAAAYNGETNINNVVVSEGTLTLEGGRTLCSTGIWSVAAGATYNQSSGTNHLMSGGNVFVIGQGGDMAQTARVDLTGGILLAPATRTTVGAHSCFILGQDRDAWMRIAETGDVHVIILEMNPDLNPDRTSTLQLDGGRLTVNRITGTAGRSNTVSRVLLNGGEIRAGGYNSNFLGDMTEVLVQTGGVTFTAAHSTFVYKTQQSFLHDPALGETLDGGLTKSGWNSLYLQTNSTYNGGTRIDLGSLYVQNDDALGTGPVTIGKVESTAALVGESGEFTITNTITLGYNGSVCAMTNATLTLTDIALSPDHEQIRVGGADTDGTVKLILKPEKPAEISTLFVYDRQTLVLDGGTIVQQIDPLLAVNPRVEVRAGSRLAVHDTDIQMPDISYLHLSGGEYWQTAGTALFPYVLAQTAWPNSHLPELPARIVLDGGMLTFTGSNLFSPSNLRGSATTINGGTFRAKNFNLSQSTQQASVSHALELNGGTLEVESIRYDGGNRAVEQATVLLNGGTLKVAAGTTATTNFISSNGSELLSVYLGGNGFVCDTAGKNIAIVQPLAIDPDLGAIPDGGFIKRGAGSLILAAPLASAGPVVVEEGTLCFANASLSGEMVEVQSGGTLELYSGGISNTTITVAAGGTLRLAQATAAGFVPNGSFETNHWGAALNYEYLTAGTTYVPGWSFFPAKDNQVGIQKNGSAFSDSGQLTTNGTTTLLFKEGMAKTTVSVPADGLYRLGFEHSMRYGQSSWLRYVDVMVDGVNVYTVKNPVGVEHGFEPVTIMVALTQGDHELAFSGRSATSGNATILIDAITLTGADPLRFDSEAMACDYRVIEAETLFEVPNGSFETYGFLTDYIYNPSGTGWRYDPGYVCGIQSNSSPFSLTPEFYTTNGVITAIIKQGKIETDFEVTWAGSYVLCFEHATRSNNESWDRRVEVKIDGVTLYTVEHNEQYHGFWPVEIPVYLEAGKHTLSFVGLHSSVNNQNATVLLDAIKLKRNNVNRTPGESILNLTTGSTVVLDNTTPLYLEYIYVDGQRLRGALRAGMSGGATVLGSGTLNTVAGGAIILIR